MKIGKLRYLHGPNLHGDRSGLLVEVALETGPDFFRDWRPGPEEMDRALRLLRAFVPELAPPAGGDLDVVRQSPQPAAQLLLAACAALLQEHCIRPEQGHVAGASYDQLRLFIPCDDRAPGLLAFRFAAACVAALPALGRDAGHGLATGLRRQRQALLGHLRGSGPNRSALDIARAAARRDIPCYRIPGSSRLLQLGQGRHRQWLDGAMMPDTGSAAGTVSRDALQTAALLASHGLPVASPRLARTLEQAQQAAAALGWPVAVSPRATGAGLGASTAISNADELGLAFARAARHDRSVLVAKHIPGADHRLQIVGGRCTAAHRQMAAQLAGDGMPAVRQPVDVTRAVHPDNRRMAERAARLLGLAVAGIDYRTADISRSWRACPGAILAVDAGPGPQPQLPAMPDPDVPDMLIDRLFPAGSNGRVPLAGITGSLGKTTTCRMLAAILAAAGHVVALASTQGTAIGDEAVRAGDRASGICGAELLLDPAVTAGVFELARGGLIKHGLGVDRVDVGAVLNVLDNHIGLDGMNSREDLARVKSLVVRNARSMAVLNADDLLCLAMAENLQAPVCLVSERVDDIAIRHHLAAGGMAVTREDRGGSPSIVLRGGGEVLGEMALMEIPATFGGRFRPAVLNAMFAAAIANGMHIGFEVIRSALASFESTYAANPGRMNFIPGLPFQLLLTWADGPQALQELARFVQGSLRDQDKTLVFYSVGNRPDGFIIDSAKAVAGGFTRYICTEMEEDLRGRQPGEVAHLLARGLREAGVPDEAIRIEPSCSAASRDALATTPAGGLLVIESFRPRNVMAEVRKVGAGGTAIKQRSP